MSRKRTRASNEQPGFRSGKRQRISVDVERNDAVYEVAHVDPPMDIYHTKTQLPCAASDSKLHEQGYIGCVPDEIVATLTGKSPTSGRRFCVNIYRDATRFTIGRASPSVLLDMRLYTTLRTVSHEHARIAYQIELRSFVLDNIGRNGTRVNGEVIRSGATRSFVTLMHNDVITIGGVDMQFKLIAPAALGAHQ
jgi:hypothetical protein